MKRIDAVAEMQAWSDGQRARGASVGFVPTMGALHEGHLALVRRAVVENDAAVASVFVNPTQFGPNEDYDSYPRVLDADSERLRELGVDVLFAPGVHEMYPTRETWTWVNVEQLDRHWCGPARPGHFRGVATVVTKLFHAVKPHRAYFGEKDYQQLKIIERLAEELLFDVEVVGVPTARAEDGLALSSRNLYLAEEARAAAPKIYKALERTRAAFRAGELDAARLLQGFRDELDAVDGGEVEYAGIADPESLEPREKGEVRGGRALAAVRLGGARLIDNIALDEAADERSPETFVPETQESRSTQRRRSS